MKKVCTFVCIALLTAFAVAAESKTDYTVLAAAGKVEKITATGSVAITKGMALLATDEVSVGCQRDYHLRAATGERGRGRTSAFPDQRRGRWELRFPDRELEP